MEESRRTRLTLATISVALVMSIALSPHAEAAADSSSAIRDCRRSTEGASRTFGGSGTAKLQPVPSNAPVAVAVSCVDVAGAAAAASAAAPNSPAASSVPAWAASSAAAADRLRQEQHDLKRELLLRSSVLALILGAAAGMMAVATVLLARAGDGLRITSHWGGFGGSGGGWHVTSAVASLALSVLLALSAAMVAGSTLKAVGAELSSAPDGKK